MRSFEGGGYLLFATKNGIAKRTELEEYRNIRRSGLIAYGLDDDDELIGVRLTSGQEDILLVTRFGQSIRFKEADVRPMGRTARGVKAMTMAPGDVVVSFDIASAGSHLLCITNRGYGKRTPVKQFRLQNRGGMGIRAMNLTPRVGQIVGVRMVTETDEVMIITTAGILIRVAVKEIPSQGRSTQGVTVMRPTPGEEVTALARVAADEEE